MTEIEIMAEIIKGIYPDWQEMSAEQLAKHLCENNIRHEVEVRAETAKEFAEKLLSPLIKAYNQSYKASGYDMEAAIRASEIKHYIDHIKQTAEQFDKEE